MSRTTSIILNSVLIMALLAFSIYMVWLIFYPKIHTGFYDKFIYKPFITSFYKSDELDLTPPKYSDINQSKPNPQMGGMGMADVAGSGTLPKMGTPTLPNIEGSGTPPQMGGMKMADAAGSGTLPKMGTPTLPNIEGSGTPPQMGGMKMADAAGSGTPPKMGTPTLLNIEGSGTPPQMGGMEMADAAGSGTPPKMGSPTLPNTTKEESLHTAIEKGVDNIKKLFTAPRKKSTGSFSDVNIEPMDGNLVFTIYDHKKRDGDKVEVSVIKESSGETIYTKTLDLGTSIDINATHDENTFAYQPDNKNKILGGGDIDFEIPVEKDSYYNINIKALNRGILGPNTGGIIFPHQTQDTPFNEGSTLDEIAPINKFDQRFMFENAGDSATLSVHIK